MEIQYDETELQKLWEELSPKERQKAMKATMRRMGATVKKEAIRQARSAQLKKGAFRFRQQMQKGFKVSVFRRVIGFTVSVIPKNSSSKNEGYYQNRYGRWVPLQVLMWTAEGTRPRQRGPKDLKKVLRYYGRGKGRQYARKGASTGAVTDTRFMAKTLDSALPSINNQIQKEFLDQIIKVGKKHGCK